MEGGSGGRNGSSHFSSERVSIPQFAKEQHLRGMITNYNNRHYFEMHVFPGCSLKDWLHL